MSEIYRLLAFLEFESEAQALDAYAQLKARSTNTRIIGAGTASERSSYARVDSSEELLAMFFVDTFGIVRNGEYVAPPNLYPLWIAPTGAHDSYPILNAAGDPTRVEYNGQNWQNTSGILNSWAPGVFGWTLVQ
jgi:hypothetical protein